MLPGAGPMLPSSTCPVVVEPAVTAALRRSVAESRLRGADRRRQRPVGVGAVRRLAWMVGWAVMVTRSRSGRRFHAPNAPALGASEQPAFPAAASPTTPVPRAGYTIGPSSGFRVGAQGRRSERSRCPFRCVAGIEFRGRCWSGRKLVLVRRHDQVARRSLRTGVDAWSVHEPDRGGRSGHRAWRRLPRHTSPSWPARSARNGVPRQLIVPGTGRA